MWSSSVTTLAFELSHPSVWFPHKEMKQKLLHMHLPTNKIIDHYNPGNRSSADRSVTRRGFPQPREELKQVLKSIHPSEKQN